MNTFVVLSHWLEDISAQNCAQLCCPVREKIPGLSMQFNSFLYIKIIWATKSAINLEGSQNILLKRGSDLKLTCLRTLKRKGSHPAPHALQCPNVANIMLVNILPRD